MHRFIPAMSTVAGARIAEIVVTHHPRRFGQSKYGLGRVWRVALDIIAFKLIIFVFTPRPEGREPSRWQRLSNVLFKRKQRALQAAAFLSLPFFVLGRVLFGSANTAALSCFGLAIALLALGGITENTIRQANRELSDLSKLARFFIFRYKRRPVRFFGPIGVLLFILGGVFLMPPIYSFLLRVLNLTEIPNLGPVFVAGGVLVFCFGLFGELIAFANAKRVKDWTVKTLLNIEA